MGHHAGTFLRKTGQGDEQPEPLLFNHEVDCDPADHKTETLISHGVLEGALSRDHWLPLFASPHLPCMDTTGKQLR